MTSPEGKLVEAKAASEQAKNRFVSTASTLQVRLKPANLASDAWEGVREKGGELAEDAIEAVKERPVKATGVVAGLALFLARHSIASLVGTLWAGRHGKDGDAGDSEEQDAAPKRARRKRKE